MELEKLLKILCFWCRRHLRLSCMTRLVCSMYHINAHIKSIFGTSNIHYHTERILSILAKTEKSKWLIAATCILWKYDEKTGACHNFVWNEPIKFIIIPCIRFFFSQSMHYACVSSKYEDFLFKGSILVSKLLRQGYSSQKLQTTFRKFCGGLWSLHVYRSCLQICMRLIPGSLDLDHVSIFVILNAVYDAH